MTSRKKFKINHKLSSVDVCELTSDLTTTMVQPKTMQRPFKLKAFVRATRRSKTANVKALDVKKEIQGRCLRPRQNNSKEEYLASTSTPPAVQLKIEQQNKKFLPVRGYSSQYEASKITIVNGEDQACKDLSFAWAHSGRMQGGNDMAMQSIPELTKNTTPAYSTEPCINSDRSFSVQRKLGQTLISDQRCPLLYIENWRIPESLHKYNDLIKEEFWKFESLRPFIDILNQVNGINAQGLQTLHSVDSILPISRFLDLSSISRPSSHVVKGGNNPEITSESRTPPAKSQHYSIAAQSCKPNNEFQNLVHRTSLDVEGVQQISTSTIHGQTSPYRKKRKQELPLKSWHATINESKARITFTRLPEFRWAVATSCLPEKEDGIEVEDTLSQSLETAWQRLRLTSCLMQQIVPPLPASLCKENNVHCFGSSVYTIAKSSLGEACKLARGACELRHTCKRAEISSSLASDRVSEGDMLHLAESSNTSPAARAMDGVTERISKLETKLKRVENCPSIGEILQTVGSLEKLRITNRLAKHHGKGSFLDLKAKKLQGEESGRNTKGLANRPFLQRYVKAVHMPRKLPEGVECFRL